MTDHIFPDDATVAQLTASDDDRPVVMLNLNRYRAVAAYGDDRDDAGLTGREAYLRYGVVALASVEAVGGKILWSTEATGDPIVGCDHDAYEEVVAVWYPSRAAFVRLPEQPGYTDALEHRDAALEQAMILPCAAFDDQRLGTPWDG